MVEKYVKELATVTMHVTKTFGIMFEQEYLRFFNMFTASGGGAHGGGNHRFPKAVMEYKVIQYFGVVSGDKSRCRQWHPKFTTALGHVEGAHEGIVQRLVKGIDLGKEMEKVVA